MKITVNGTVREDVADGTSVAGLLDDLKLSGQPVLVELNGTALFPREFPDTKIEENASLEIIRIAAGG